jgi:hypothetical protein
MATNSPHVVISRLEEGVGRTWNIARGCGEKGSAGHQRWVPAPYAGSVN